jgi:hypothetical protein
MEAITMRGILLILALLGVGILSQPAQADPYRWCAQYSGRNGAVNCYFKTYEQCRAAISGVGGFCRRNTWYNGRR